MSAAVRVARQQRRLAAWLERHAKPAGEVSCVLPNGATLVMIGDGDDVLSGVVRWRGWEAYEPDVIPVWWHLASTATTVLDIGANVGLLSLLAAHASGQGTVWAFEPCPPSVIALERNVAANPGVDVRVVPCAVGASTGRTALHWDPQCATDGMATTLSEHPSGPRATAQFEVPRVAIDEWAAAEDLARVDLVKIDVEGAGAEVLAGMTRVLERHRPDLVVEVLGDDEAAAIRRLRGTALGYEHYLLTTSGPVQTNEIEPRASCPNHLLTVRPSRDLQGLKR